MLRKSTVTPIRAAVADLLMRPAVVAMIDPLTRRGIRHMGVVVHPDFRTVSAYTRAEIFWGLYERAECSFIRRYLSGSIAVIELGAGLGVASTHIAAGLAPGGTLVCVEANPRFIPLVERNLRRGCQQPVILNAAIARHDGTSALQVQENPFASYVAGVRAVSDGGEIPVTTRSLISIVEEHRLQSFDLVCDIEGGEASFILGADATGLEQCRRLVIELHDSTATGTPVAVADLLSTLSDRWGFAVLDRKGPIVALAKGG